MIILNPKSEDDIIKELSSLTQKELNNKLLVASRNNSAGVKMLLDAGADVNAKDNYGWPALDYNSNKSNIIKLLKQYGAQ